LIQQPVQPEPPVRIPSSTASNSIIEDDDDDHDNLSLVRQINSVCNNDVFKGAFLAKVRDGALVMQVMRACYALDNRSVSSDQIDKVSLFMSKVQEPKIRYDKGEFRPTTEANPIRDHYDGMIRFLWKNSNLFDAIDPKNNLISTGIETSERFSIIVVTLSKWFVKTIFNNKRKLADRALLTIDSKYIQ
jgi:hypothetical protein